jgi:tetratricopeptide (TPR) repeat protein
MSVFISHTTEDDPVVKKIRQALQSLGIDAWVDSRQLAGGDKLAPEIQNAIKEKTHFIAVLSPKTINSPWVKKEIDYALGLGKKVIPVMLPGIKPSALAFWFGSTPHDEPVGVPLADGPGGVSNSLPGLLEALGEKLPADKVAAVQAEFAPIADLLLELTEPAIDTSEGKHRATAKAKLIYQPADGGRKAESTPFRFTAPLGPIEADELAWYLERYINWPSGVFQQRAKQVEQKLPEWGGQLYDALPREALQAWEKARQERRFTIKVNKHVFEASPERQKEADEAATVLLSLPWELIHDKRSFLFQGANAVRVRRTLPSRESHDAVATDPPLKVLLVSPRPEDESARYIDHRASARPLVEALSKLGDLAEFKLLTPPTFAALEQELKRDKYHVVHFDGHGVYDRAHGLGDLCFENPEDSRLIEKRRSHRVPADQIAAVVRDHRVPLFFLDACQTAKTEADPSASVAGKLLESGVASVAAMSHSVLVETTRRFVSEFYPELLSGKRVGQAMLAGQSALQTNTFRGKVFTGDLNLQDWFVPVLFQEEQDPQLIREVPAARVQAIFAKQKELALGDVPAEPGYGFVGRSRELLKAERALENQRYVVLQGEGGEGKTTLGAELARWLVLTQRFRRAAFVKMDEDGDRRKTLFAIGRQLVADFISRAERNPDDTLKLIERALEEDATAIVFDNMESILPPAAGSEVAGAFDPDVLKEILDLCGALSKSEATRIIFTSREPLPEPFAGNVQRVGRLDRPDAIRLVGRVLGEGKLMPHTGDAGESEEEIESLVDAVGCHARSLVLLAGEVAVEGVRHATGNLHQLMASLEKKHPGERERSLLASVELSLRRLPVETRRRIRPLGVFQGGGNMYSIATVLGLDTGKDEQIALAGELIGVGLAEDAGFGYLRFEPALAPALLGEMSDDEHKAARTAWAQAMAAMMDLLYRPYFFKDGNHAANLALRELPNLLAALDVLCESETPERTVYLATSMEQLIARGGRAKALERVAEIRDEAAGHLSAWTNASFEAARAEIERTMEQGRHNEAVAAANALLDRAKKVAQSTYDGADYDLAIAHIVVGRALQGAGSAQAAIAHLDEARQRFQALGQTLMAGVALSDKSDGLRGIGHFEEAAKGYQEAIELAEDAGDLRSVGTNKNQLATVRRLQQKYPEALKLYGEVRDTFIGLCEPGSVATTWQQIGNTYQGAGQYEAAEKAYQESLKIDVQIGNRSREANTLLSLGVLYSRMGRHEEAIQFYAKAAEVFTQLGDLKQEGFTHDNVACALIQLRRYDEARREIERAIECGKPFGHVAEPWKSFDILCDLEHAMGNEPAAREARRQAIESYLAYRRDDGESQAPSGQLCASVAEQPAEAGAILELVLQEPEMPARARPLISALQSVLGGSRDVTLADDPNLDYDDAAELLLLIESLPK